jgi:hypothetical protein
VRLRALIRRDIRRIDADPRNAQRLTHGKIVSTRSFVFCCFHCFRCVRRIEAGTRNAHPHTSHLRAQPMSCCCETVALSHNPSNERTQKTTNTTSKLTHFHLPYTAYDSLLRNRRTVAAAVLRAWREMVSERRDARAAALEQSRLKRVYCHIHTHTHVHTHLHAPTRLHTYKASVYCHIHTNTHVHTHLHTLRIPHNTCYNCTTHTAHLLACTPIRRVSAAKRAPQL